MSLRTLSKLLLSQQLREERQWLPGSHVYEDAVSEGLSQK